MNNAQPGAPSSGATTEWVSGLRLAKYYYMRDPTRKGIMMDAKQGCVRELTMETSELAVPTEGLRLYQLLRRLLLEEGFSREEIQVH